MANDRRVIEYIETTDTLNEGRVKIKDAITGANDALDIAGDADDKATEALSTSALTQTQLDTIVIDGDSSVEAAQARVDKSGYAYSTLKDRLDTENQNVTEQLTHKVNVEDMEQALDEKVTLTDESTIITVGSEGDFDTLNGALTYLTKKQVTYKSNGISVIVMLLKDYKMREQVINYSIDMGWITIRSEENPVMVVGSQINTPTNKRGGTVSHALFFGANGAIMPRIDGVVFELDGSEGHTPVDGYILRENSRGEFDYNTGFLKVTGNGIYVAYGSTLSAMNVEVSGGPLNTEVGIYVRHNSSINGRGGSTKPYLEVSDFQLEGLRSGQRSSPLCRDIFVTNCGGKARKCVV